MPDLPISIHFTDQEFEKLFTTLQPIAVGIKPPGIYLYELLDSVSGGAPLSVVETGCLRDTNPSALMTDGWSTLYLARWNRNHPGSYFQTVEIDSGAIAKCREFLRSHGALDSFVHFVNGDSMEFLRKTKADVYFLDSCDGLEHGLSEFRAALEHKPKLIIMDDFDTKAALAAEFAIQNDISHQRVDRYTVFNTRGF